jgi:hypothetical protein
MQPMIDVRHRNAPGGKIEPSKFAVGDLGERTHPDEVHPTS